MMPASTSNATSSATRRGDLKSSNPLLSSSITEGEFTSLTGVGFITFDQTNGITSRPNDARRLVADEQRPSDG